MTLLIDALELACFQIGLRLFTHFIFSEQVSRSSVTHHYYAVITNSANFDDALKRSSESSYAGVQGHLFVPNTFQELLDVATNFMLPVSGVHNWLGFTDSASEGKYLIAAGPNAGTDASEIIPWEKGEPNGGMQANCVVVSFGYSWSTDIPCGEFKVDTIEYECPFGQRFNDQGTACIGTVRILYQWIQFGLILSLYRCYIRLQQCIRGWWLVASPIHRHWKLVSID